MLSWTAVYNRAVTGDAFELPYQTYDREYAIAPPLLWMAEREEPDYEVPEIAAFWRGFALNAYRSQRTLAGFFSGLGGKIGLITSFFLGPIGLVALVLYLIAPATRLRAALVVMAVFFLGFAGETYRMPHYFAPCAPLLLLFTTAGLRRLSSLRLGGQRTGRWLTGFLLLAAIVGASERARALPALDGAWHERRAELRERLAAEGRHLVFVRYGPRHSPHEEWVYNAADLDASPVVFARDLDKESRSSLGRHMHDRTLWTLFVDHWRDPPRLEPLTREGLLPGAPEAGLPKDD